MLSRDADACYWIGRYVERAEAIARMVDVHYHTALETYLPALMEPGESDSDEVRPLQWQSLLEISADEARYAARYEQQSDREVLYFFAFDLDNPNSILSVWRAARENARVIREQIASEMWESLNASYLRLREWNIERLMAGSPHEFFQMVKNASHLFQGILNRTLMMGESRDWIDIGRFLERADQNARLLDVRYYNLMPAVASTVSDPDAPVTSSALEPVDGSLDVHAWIAVLKSVCAFEMYRKTHRGGIIPAQVVEFLVLNPQFPASVRHCIDRVAGCLQRISGTPISARPGEPQRLVGLLAADLAYARSQEILTGNLHEFLDDVQRRCMAIGRAIAQTYLTY